MYSTFAESHSPATRARAAAGYGRVTLEARIAGASPHELIMMLYKRLMEVLRDARNAAETGDIINWLKSVEKALVIIDGLDATLDLKRGGSVAESLRAVYEQMRARVLSTDPSDLETAFCSVQDIAEAWAKIRPA